MKLSPPLGRPAVARAATAHEEPDSESAAATVFIHRKCFRKKLGRFTALRPAKRNGIDEGRGTGGRGGRERYSGLEERGGDASTSVRRTRHPVGKRPNHRAQARGPNGTRPHSTVGSRSTSRDRFSSFRRCCRSSRTCVHRAERTDKRAYRDAEHECLRSHKGSAPLVDPQALGRGWAISDVGEAFVSFGVHQNRFPDIPLPLLNERPSRSTGAPRPDQIHHVFDPLKNHDDRFWAENFLFIFSPLAPKIRVNAIARV